MSQADFEKDAGVLGFNMEQRTDRDRQMLASYGCAGTMVEGYMFQAQPGVTGNLIEPRTQRDMQMLQAYAPMCNGGGMGATMATRR